MCLSCPSFSPLPAAIPDTVLLTPEGTEKLRAYLEARRCRSEALGDATIWRKNGFGRYGTFVTHLSILLTVIFGALALYTPTVTDQTCMPGESIVLEDGTEIHVLDFHIPDETLYPDFLRDPSGNVTLITVTEGSYPNPIYQVEVISDGVFTPTLAEPGDELEVMGLRFAFNSPVDYPGIRIKHVSALCNALLIASFTLLIAGLFITFFCEPGLVKTDAEGYAVCGPKPERMRLELGAEFREYERTKAQEK